VNLARLRVTKVRRFQEPRTSDFGKSSAKSVPEYCDLAKHGFQFTERFLHPAPEIPWTGSNFFVVFRAFQNSLGNRLQSFPYCIKGFAPSFVSRVISRGLLKIMHGLSDLNLDLPMINTESVPSNISYKSFKT
jgi:hypothetical protein